MYLIPAVISGVADNHKGAKKNKTEHTQEISPVLWIKKNCAFLRNIILKVKPKYWKTFQEQKKSWRLGEFSGSGNIIDKLGYRTFKKHYGPEMKVWSS